MINTINAGQRVEDFMDGSPASDVPFAQHLREMAEEYPDAYDPTLIADLTDAQLEAGFEAFQKSDREGGSAAEHYKAPK